MRLHSRFAYTLFHRYARKVRHFLTQAGESIEERRLTGVRRPDDGHHMRTRALLQ
jgi:hypothetical protein